MIITMETQEEQKRMAIVSKLKSGMAGLGEGHDRHMLDVSELIALTSERTIAQFWMKAGILPVGV